MDDDLRRLGQTAVERLDALIAADHPVPHDAVRDAVSCVVAFRNGAVRRHRAGALDRRCLDGANAALSLAYGTQFPLAGFHPHRLEQVRDAVSVLLASGEHERS
jgi:hypothetical protein